MIPARRAAFTVAPTLRRLARPTARVVTRPIVTTAPRPPVRAPAPRVPLLASSILRPPTAPVGLAPFAARRNVWTTTYWPMAGSGDGDPRSNLWAKGGALDKVDQLLKARGEDTGALEHEKRPSLGWLADAPTGYWVPASRVLETDFERTSGVDIDGDGKLSADVKHDFLDTTGSFRTDGKHDGVLNVGWWGSCDKVALAGMLFGDPAKSVTIDGVTFTPQDIRGLLTVIADSQAQGIDFVGHRTNGSPDEVRTTDGRRLRGTIEGMDDAAFRSGRGEFETVRNLLVRRAADADVTIVDLAGKEHVVPASEVALMVRETEDEPSAATFDATVRNWIGEERPFAMDTSSGTQVWNYSYDTVKFDSSVEPPSSAELNGHAGPAGDGDIEFITAKISGANTQTYRYWIEQKDGAVVNSGWLSKKPDFLWRPKNAEPAWTGANPRNPYVSPGLVKEIYEKSLA